MFLSAARRRSEDSTFLKDYLSLFAISYDRFFFALGSMSYLNFADLYAEVTARKATVRLKSITKATGAMEIQLKGCSLVR